jgi:hypothetical protein
MEAVRTSETSVNLNVITGATSQKTLSKLHTRRRQNLKSHINDAINKRVTFLLCRSLTKFMTCIYLQMSTTGFPNLVWTADLPALHILISL